VAAYFPPDYMVIEIMEDIDPTPDLIEELRNLKSQGYILAMDDLIYRPALDPILAIADMVKIDFLDSVFTMRNFYAVCAHIDLAKCQILAEKVENQKVYEKARDLGCQLFQGYFFAKPAAMTQKTVGVMRVNVLRLLSEVSRKEVDFDKIAEVVKQDIGLTYKILKLVNSAYFGLTKEISDIKRAVVYLGHKELKKWISFAALTDIGDSKPPELVEMSLVRAHFCEMVSIKLKLPQESDAFFLTGLFSLLDAMLDAKIETVLEDVKLPELAHRTLMGENNYLRDTLNLIIALEQGNWDAVTGLSETIGLAGGDMSELYADSLQWSAELHKQNDIE
jgi:EAL and modified HD-GYP domain-containing signal transduction protein